MNHPIRDSTIEILREDRGRWDIDGLKRGQWIVEHSFDHSIKANPERVRSSRSLVSVEWRGTRSHRPCSQLSLRTLLQSRSQGASWRCNMLRRTIHVCGQGRNVIIIYGELLHAENYIRGITALSLESVRNHKTRQPERNCEARCRSHENPCWKQPIWNWRLSVVWNLVHQMTKRK